MRLTSCVCLQAQCPYVCDLQGSHGLVQCQLAASVAALSDALAPDCHKQAQLLQQGLQTAVAPVSCNPRGFRLRSCSSCFAHQGRVRKMMKC